MLKAIKWFISRIRNTFIILFIALFGSIIGLFLGLLAISFIVISVPTIIIGLFVLACHLIITGWLRTEDPAWYKALKEKLAKEARSTFKGKK